MKRMSRLSTRTALAAVAAGSLALAACSPANQNDSDQSVSDQATSGASSAASEAKETATNNGESALTFEDAYVTAKPADKEMTGVFGTLKNSSDEDIHITEVEGSLSGMYQLHVVDNGEMKESPEGFTIKAGQSLELQPGHEHIMIMDNHDEIAAGDDVTLTLKDEQGKTYELKDVPVRVQQSTHEHYSDGTTGDSGKGEGEYSEHSEHSEHGASH